MNDASLVKISEADRMLIEAKSVEDCISVADMAEAARAYAKRVGASIPLLNRVVCLKLRAERKAGEMLAMMDKAKGGGDVRKHRSQRATSATLSDLNISKTKSARWQRAAIVPEEQFREYEEKSNAAEREMTSAGLYKLANIIAPKNGARRPEPIDGIFSNLEELSGKSFGTIYADPPWKYANQGTRASTKHHYGTMTVDEICALPVRGLAAEKCHLHLWTTNAYLFECCKLFEAWGFEFKSSFVWVKPQMGIGNYWRNSHEMMLLAVKGGQTAISKSEMSWIKSNRGRHSSKPEKVRDSIMRLSPGPFLELFGRRAVPGWAVFGNQVVEELV